MSARRRRQHTPIPRGRRGPKHPHRLVVIVLALVGTAAALALHIGLNFHPVVAYLFGVNGTTLLLYAYDKYAAPRPGWPRVSERALHGAALLGGTPAALFAQGLLRHKTVKRPFRAWFIATVVVQVLAVGAWAYVRALR